MADHRPDAYLEGDQLILRASSLGGCVSSIVRQALGHTPQPPPEDLERRWAEGVVAEPIILREAARRGWKQLGPYELPAVKFTDDDPPQPELELTVGKVTIRCHPDAIGQCWIGAAEMDDGDTLLVNRQPEEQHTGGRFNSERIVVPDWQQVGDRRVLEAKALRPSFDRKFAPYQWQMSVEMAVSGLPGLWLYGTKDDEGLVDPATVEMVPVDDPPYSVVDIKRRAIAIYRAVMDAEIPKCDVKMFPCGFYIEPDTACGGAGKPTPLAFPEDLLDEMAEVVVAYKRAKVALTPINKELEAAKKRIKEIVSKAGLEPGMYATDGVRVTWKGGRTKVDVVAMAADYNIDVAKYQSTGEGWWEVGDDGRGGRAGASLDGGAG